VKGKKYIYDHATGKMIEKPPATPLPDSPAFPLPTKWKTQPNGQVVRTSKA